MCTLRLCIESERFLTIFTFGIRYTHFPVFATLIVIYSKGLLLKIGQFLVALPKILSHLNSGKMDQLGPLFYIL